MITMIIIMIYIYMRVCTCVRVTELEGEPVRTHTLTERERERVLTLEDRYVYYTVWTGSVASERYHSCYLSLSPDWLPSHKL